MESLACIKCGHTWTPRKGGKPLRCPACDTRQWDTGVSERTDSGSVEAKPSRRIVLDDTHAERVCEKCEHEWVGPKYKHCPACDRPRWWEPRQQTKAEQKSTERKADAERRKANQKRRDEEREREREERQAQEDTDRKYHASIGDVQNTSIWGGPQWIPWAQVFDRVWRAYEDATEAARSEAEHKRWLDRERAEREREIERKLEAEAKAAQAKREREIERQKQRERVLRSQAAQSRAREAWLDTRWHRRPCAALSKAAPAILSKLPAVLFAVLIVVAAILLMEYGIKPMLEGFTDANN